MTDETIKPIEERIKQVRDAGFEPIHVTFTPSDSIKLLDLDKLKENANSSKPFRCTEVDGVPFRVDMTIKESFIAIKLH